MVSRFSTLILAFSLVLQAPAQADPCGLIFFEQLRFHDLLMNQASPAVKEAFPENTGMCGPTCGVNILQLMRYAVKGEISSASLDDMLKIVKIIQSENGTPLHGTSAEDMRIALMKLIQEEKFDAKVWVKESAVKMILSTDFYPATGDLFLFSVHGKGVTGPRPVKPVNHWLLAIPNPVNPKQFKVIDPNGPAEAFFFTTYGQGNDLMVGPEGLRPAYLRQTLRIGSYLGIKLNHAAAPPPPVVNLNSPFRDPSTEFGKEYAFFFRLRKNKQGKIIDSATGEEDLYSVLGVFDRRLESAREKASFLIMGSTAKGNGKYVHYSGIEFTADDYDDLIMTLRSDVPGLE